MSFLGGTSTCGTLEPDYVLQMGVHPIRNKRQMRNNILHDTKINVMKTAGVISRYLHVPVGVAVILAVILVPKVLAIMMIVWYIMGVVSARRIDHESGT